jgi:hypothetical protein
VRIGASSSKKNDKMAIVTRATSVDAAAAPTESAGLDTEPTSVESLGRFFDTHCWRWNRRTR